MRKIISLLLFLTASHAWALKSSEVLIEAQSAFMRGDLFNSYRFYTLAIDKTPKALDVKDVENFVISEYITMNLKNFLTSCRKYSSGGELSVEFSFYCAKVLIHNERFTEATEFIERIPQNYQRLEYDVLNATLKLNLNKPDQCLDEMQQASKKITNNTSLHFQDLMKVVTARCYLAQGRFEQASAQFQTLSVNSDYYLATLEEQAWTQFKQRNLVSSREILKILISYFTSQDIKNQIFGADVYFRTKYLQAYIELISQNREKARDMFTQLKTEIQKFKKANFAKMILPKDFDERMRSIDSETGLLKKNYQFIVAFRQFIYNWSPTEETKQFDNHLRDVIALNQELKTSKLLSPQIASQYIGKIKKLRNNEMAWLRSAMVDYFHDSKHMIDTIEFKANMGQVENFWADRTEGKRTLAEVLEAYKNEVNNVEDRLGK